MSSIRRQEDAFFIVFGGGLVIFFIYAAKAASTAPDSTFVFRLIMTMFVPLILANFAYSLGRGHSRKEKLEDATWFQIIYTLLVLVAVMVLGFRSLLFFERFYGYALDRTIVPFFYSSLILCGGILNQFKYRNFAFSGFLLGLMSGLGLYLIVDSFRKAIN